MVTLSIPVSMMFEILKLNGLEEHEAMFTVGAMSSTKPGYVTVQSKDLALRDAFDI